LADFRADLRAEERRADFLAPFLADFLVDFFADFLRADFADFLRADFLPEDFLRADFLAPLFLAAFLRGRGLRVRSPISSPSSNADDDDPELDGGVLSIGSGSIHPEPDQPISIL
jgi:hypothetical protein